MARVLKQSTAFTFRIGPFLDEDNGKTAETGLTIAQADIQISKNGGAFAQTSDGAPTTTHDTDGWYQCPVTTTDTGTLGPLTVQITKSGALPVWEHFLVVPANVFDSLHSTGKLDVQVAGTNDIDLSATQKASVNTEVVDVLKIDTIAQLPQQLPPSAPTLEKAIMYLYQYLRNKRTQTSTEVKMYAEDESTVIAKAAVSDDSTTATKAEFATGP
jgi:hypothetical protein